MASDLALDDISVTNGQCPQTKFCDFEFGACNFLNLNMDPMYPMNWMVGRPYTDSIDHTTNSNKGRFVYVNLDQGPLNSTAKLASPAYEGNGVECLQFWYLNVGAYHNNTLNIYERRVFANNSTAKFMNDGKPLWTRHAHSNDEWRYGQVTVNTAGSESFQLVFEVVKHQFYSYGTMIGLDDIDIKMGACSSPLDCNFEEFSTCSWSTHRSSEATWQLAQGSMYTLGNTPDVDVTLGTSEGVYLMVSTNPPVKEDDTAKLVSDYIEAGSIGCLRFWYHMNDGLYEQSGKLNVYKNDTLASGLKSLSHLEGSHGDEWHQLELDVTDTNEYQLVIEAVVGSI